MAGKRVGIMGGTFNPIHLGEMLIGENAYETFDLDEILFVPRGSIYYKEDLLDEKTRITLTGIAIEDNSHFALSTIEVDRGDSFTYQTIETLKEKNPLNTYFYIVGYDTYVDMPTWKNPDKIFSEVEIIVAPRLGVPEELVEKTTKELEEKYNAKIHFLHFNCLDISGTSIRDRVKKNKSIRYMVHYKVIEYINKFNLYQDNE